MKNLGEYGIEILETIREPLLILDNELKIVKANQAFYNTFKRSMKATVGFRIYELDNKQWDIPQLRTLLTDILSKNSFFQDFEMEDEFPGVGKKTLVLNARRVKNSEQGTQYILLAIEDYTERKKHLRELEKAMEELKRSNEELEQFAYVASHDLQEPLRMVSSYTQLLERRYKDKLDQDAKDFINYAVDGATRMKVLINDLLQYSRVTTRGNVFESVNLNELVNNVLEDISTLIKENQAVIKAENLPSVNGDMPQLRRVFQNLISNAIKYRGESPPQITISSEERKKDWVISIIDNGIGIDPKHMERVFIIFQRLHGKDEYGGTGIGLALCKRIVERHGGKIWITSNSEVGSTFHFSLPKKQKY